MDVRSPLFQNVASVLVGVMFLNPIVSVAADLTVAAGSGATLDQARNGVPVVNIAAPNGNGLSHNKFKDYNVGQQGLILNNATNNTQATQLGGIILGNPNLKGRAAGLILNEVTGANASRLQGYTEVAGKSAHVVVANPHGITCDGCGFINTPRVTLSTGTPMIENGRLDRFDVNGGSIAIEGLGLNASNVDQFDLITRSAKINAELHANKLNIITGRNEVKADNLSVTAKATDGSDKPLLAIDSSALGGMYAGAIRLVGTEAGVGVKLAGDMAASAGDIQIDANGKLSLNRVAASGDVSLTANTIDLNADTYAGRNADIEAQQVDVRESLAAGQRLAVQAGQLNNAGIIEAGVRANGSVSSAGHLQLEGGKVRNAGQMTSHGSMATDLQALDNRGGKVAAAASATLKTEQLDNREGEILAQGNLTLSTQALDNRQGSALSGQALTIEAESVDNAAGTLAAGDSIQADVSERLNNTAGLIEAGGQLSVQAGALDNRSGKLRALGSGGESRLAVDGQLNNQAGQIEIGNASLVVEVGSLGNRDGLIRHVGAQTLDMSIEQLGQAGGRIQTNAQLDLKADTWTNTTELQAGRITVDIAELTQTKGAALLARDDIEAKGDTWRNDGRIETDGSLSLELEDAYAGDGTLIAQGDLTVSATDAALGTNAKWLAGGSSKLSVLGDLVSRGQMTAGTWLQLAAQNLRNHGTIGATGQLSLQAGDIRNEDGFLFSGASMLLVADRFTNQRGDLYSVGDLQFVANERDEAPELFANLSGVVESEGNITIRAKQITNAHEAENLIVSRKIAAQFYSPDCTDCSGDKENVRYRLRQIDRTEATSNVRTASLLAGGDLSLSGQAINNRYSMLAANGAVRITGDTFASVGAETGEYISEGRATSEREKSQGWIHDNVRSFNARNWPTGSANIEADLNNILRNTLKGSFEHFGTTYTPDAEQSYAAIVQAGGDVTIDAKEIGNASIRPSFSFVNGGTRADTGAPGSDIATLVTLNPQLPPDLQQKAVDPLSLPGFSLPAGQNGLFSLSNDPGHRYLIETNPAFANLGRFLNSDYMLGLLGYDPDDTQRRLGDGFYEQRLVRDAVRARTGQRYLAGLDSDEAQFKYLMDNAIASKETLNLSLGIALSAEQVAALTHNIVWMEEREVQGHKVLVPVLYLAQAEGRLAPSGALIQGRDVALISGGDLSNSGTLRASQNLSLTAQQNIANSGLMHANERLSLLAGDSIRNTQGGILKGQDVSLVAVTGDVVNERTVSNHHSTTRNTDRQQSFVDSAARIEAGNDLLVSAGNDIRNIGGAISAGADASLQAGNDLILGSAEAENRQNRWDRKGHSYRTDITQYGSEVQVGGDLQARAGHDLSVVASQLKAGDSLELRAGGDLLISSAANENHFFSRSKKVTQSRDQVTQQSSEIQAGRDLSLDAGNDLSVIASRVTAGSNVDLNAGQDINILSAMDESASFYFKKKKGSFGRSSSKQQESYDSTNIASVIVAGNDLTINTSKTAEGGLSLDGGRDVTVIGSQLSAGNDLLLGATGDIAVLSGVEEHGSYSKKTKSGFLGMSKSGKSQLKTSATQVASELEAGNDVVIAAGNDVRFRASETRAGNDVELRAGLISDTGDINLVSANDEAYSRSEEYKKKVGLSLSDAVGLAVGTPSFGGDITLASAKKAGQEAIRSTNVGSQVVADRNATLAAERDINIVGSGVSAGRNVLLDAGRDVNIVAGTERTQTTSWENTKTFGMQQDFDRNGYTTFVGQEKLKDKQLEAQQTAAASQIHAGLDLDVRAGRDVVQQGSDMSAGYDLSLQAGRNILIDAAIEQSLYERETSQTRTGTSTTVNHNFGNMVDAVNGAGKGENTVSQASGVLKAADGVSQFLSGPTFDGHAGSTSQSQSVSQSGTASRGSTLDAGNDVTLTAGNSVVVRGSQLQSGRDIKVTAQDILLDVARGEQRYEQEQTQGKGGIVGGTTGGFKVGIGGSHGSAKQEGSQGTASGAQLQAGRDILLDASNDLSLIGTEVWAGRDIDLSAGNDLLITAAGNAQGAEEKRRSGGGEVGLTFGSEGIGVYASVNLGKGNLEREGERQQEAYLYAGNRLGLDSGQDTTIAGPQLRGNEVIGRVGGDLLVTSLPDTSKVKGREFDLSATVTIGPGSGFSGSVGYGETRGSTHWVENQTRITAAERLDIRTENHTQIDGALIASDSGDLKLDTDTLGFSDIAGHDKEHSYYLNVGGSYGAGQQDQSQAGKGEEGQTGWSLSGYEYEKEREQIVRATVGEGEIVVRNDEQTGNDSTAGLNRDTGKAYEITRDEEERTDLYASKSSVEAVANPGKTLQAWGEALVNYDEQAKANFEQLGVLANASLNELEKLTGRTLAEGAVKAGGAEIAEQTLYGLIMSGMSLDAAKALLANQAFQEQVLANLSGIDNVFSATPDLLKTVERGLAEANLLSLPDVVVLPEQEVTPGALRPEQAILGRVSDINAYIEANPDQEQAVGFVLAAAQGPKGLIMWAASQALSDTPFGEQVAQYQAYLEGILGKAIAEGVEGHDLDASYDDDAYLLGGGGLIGTLLVGAVAGASNSKAIGTKNALPGGQTAAQFEKSLSSLPPGERVAQIKSTAASVTIANGMVKDNKLSKLNGREVYRASDGNLYALDTQHGRFEVVSPKNGKHLGEVDFEFKQTKPSDKTGGHDLKVR